MIKGQDGITCQAIMIWRKKYKNYSSFTFITPKQGIITSAIPHRRLQSLKNSGYLRPFSAVYITVVPSLTGYTLQQVDGIYAIANLEENLKNISYAAIAGETLMALFAKNDVDVAVYNVTSQFSKAIRTKPIQLASIIFIGHLIALAGLMPSKTAFMRGEGTEEFWLELKFTLGHHVSNEVKWGLSQILQYDWITGRIESTGQTLQLPQKVWRELEQIFYRYIEAHIGRELQSVKFLQDMV